MGSWGPFLALRKSHHVRQARPGRPRAWGPDSTRSCGPFPQRPSPDLSTEKVTLCVASGRPVTGAVQAAAPAAPQPSERESLLF